MLDKKIDGDKTAVTIKAKTQYDCGDLYVLGEFNEWQPEKMKKLKGNIFTKKYSLDKNSRYQYVFFDRELNCYFADEDADEIVRNEFGTFNSVVYA